MEGQKLELDPRWKWAYICINKKRVSVTRPKPYTERDLGFFSEGDNADLPIVNDLGEPPDSLHQIIDGRLVKYVDVPEDGCPVIVGSKVFERRYSAALTSWPLPWSFAEVGMSASSITLPFTIEQMAPVCPGSMPIII